MGSNVQCQLLQGRDYPPKHFTLRIDSFSLMVKYSIHEYISDQFHVGDYDWILHIHPNGKKKEGEGSISLYLELVDTSSLISDWPINAVIRFFVLNQITNKYYTSGPDSIVRFHPLRRLFGVDRFIDLPTFKLSSNGYLVNDQCVFGTEVFLVNPDPVMEMLVLKDENNSFTVSHIWEVKSFSSLSLDIYESEIFTCGDFEWKIRLHPNGSQAGKNNSISVFLKLDDAFFPSNVKFYVKYRIVLLNNGKSSKIDFTGYKYFSDLFPCWGYPKFVALDKLQNPKNELLVDDCLSIEAHVTILGMVNTIT